MVYERDVIAAAYDTGINEEIRRLTDVPFGEVEYKLTVEILDRFITPGSAIADIGCGPGKYAEHLISRSCRVGAVDLSHRSLEFFLQRIPPTRSGSILFSKKGCATDLSFIPDESMDAALLMGPLYHLSQEKDREKAVDECLRILKPGGHIFTTFLSPYSECNLAVEKHSAKCQNKPDMSSFSDSNVATVVFSGFVLPQVRCWPTAAALFMQAHGFEIIHIRNLDGILSNIKQELESRTLPVKMTSDIFEIAHQMCDLPSFTGVPGQYLYVGKKSF